MRKVYLVLVLFLYSISSTVLFAQETLTWSMDLSINKKSASFSRPLTLKSGEKFSLAIKAEQACFAYLIYTDPKGNMDIILNKQFTAGEYWQQAFELEPPSGRETIFVIMSLTKLKDLEKAAEALKNKNNSRTARDLNNAVAVARRSASRFNENPERPVGMGGSVRGEDDFVEVGTEFSGAGMYVKTIIINH